MMWFASCIILPVVLGAMDTLERLLALAKNPVGWAKGMTLDVLPNSRAGSPGSNGSSWP